ncbi:MAG TPA: hypothetical protein ENN09_01740, partial [Planctomycetes bacterium]|nr:hypothetical protein [Planctomycetota bacterium]
MKLAYITAVAAAMLGTACFAEDASNPLRSMIVRNADALRGKNVYIDVFGRPMNASFADADDVGVTVEAAGQPLTLAWEQLKPPRLIRMALRAAASSGDFCAVAGYAHAEGLAEEAQRILDDAVERHPGAIEEISALRNKLFPEPPKPQKEEKAAPAGAADAAPTVTSKAAPSFVPTFHCLSVYWSPEGGEDGKKVFIRYREHGQKAWRDGLPMRYNPVKTPECKADYRGSIVNLMPGTAYEVTLQLEGADVRTAFMAATWSERFPVSSVVKCSSSGSTLNVSRSGTPDGYVLYDGAGALIDTGNRSNVGISVDASYVIIRGFTIRNVREHGIRIMAGKHIVIEDCDISKWGSESEKGFGIDYQAGVFSNNKDVRAVVIQRCKIHHPTWNSNSWAEDHKGSRHPSGPQTVVFWEAEGNHVIRYNEFWSDEKHYFNDVLGAGYNSGYRGFPGADSDIYCNYV